MKVNLPAFQKVNQGFINLNCQVDISLIVLYEKRSNDNARYDYKWVTLIDIVTFETDIDFDTQYVI